MRLPLVPQLSTKDGVSNKNARLTNCLKEARGVGDVVTVRPGLGNVTQTLTPAIGNGITSFNDKLISVFGANLAIADIDPPVVVSFPTMTNIDDTAAFSGYHEFVITDIKATATVEGYSNLVVVGYGTVDADGFAKGFRWEETTGLVALGEYYDSGASRAFLLTNAGVPYGVIYLDENSTPVASGADGYYLCSFTDEVVSIVEFIPSGSPMLRAINPLGTAGCGWGTSNSSPWRWTLAGGYESLTIAEGGTSASVYDISDDGNVIVGWYNTSGAVGRIFRWTPAGGMVSIGNLGTAAGYARNVSSDGSIVIGLGTTGAGYSRLFKWESGTGMVDLAAAHGQTYDLMTINDVTPDANAAVGGKSEIGSVDVAAYLWQSGIGFTIITRPGQTYSEAYAVSDDGTVVYGYAVVAGVKQFWKWDDGVVTDISIPAAYDTFYLYNATEDQELICTASGDGMVAKLVDTGVEQVPLVYGGSDVLPRFRSLVDLEDVQMDFAQSTL